MLPAWLRASEKLQRTEVQVSMGAQLDRHAHQLQKLVVMGDALSLEALVEALAVKVALMPVVLVGYLVRGYLGEAQQEAPLER